MVSNHYINRRYQREKFINEYLNGDGKVIDSFIVDRNHPNGTERHEITDHGIIIIYNNRSNLLVSKLIARPGQIKRYYVNTDKEPSQWLLTICEQHKKLNYNKV